MWGAIIGDVIGSRFENENLFSEYFELFDEHCVFTDDTVMTLATLMILQNYPREQITSEVVINEYRKLGCSYIQRGFGGMFYQWLVTYNQGAYGSYGNGALMRISPLAKWAVDNNWTKQEMLDMSDIFTNVTHNHKQALDAVHLYLSILYDLSKGLSGVEDYLLREEKGKEIIRNLINETIWSEIKSPRYFKIQNTKEINLSCEYTLALVFSVLKDTIERTDESYAYKFETGMKKVISLGGDCDTTAAILGPILEIIYGIVPAFKYSAFKIAFKKYDQPLIDALNKFYNEDVREDAMYMKPNYSYPIL